MLPLATMKNFLQTGLGRTTLSHLILAVYLVAADQFVFDAVQSVYRGNQQSLALGICLLFLLAIETIALWIKLPIAVTAARSAKGVNPVILLWIFHTLVSLLIYVRIMQSLGYSTVADKPLWVKIGMGVMIVRSLVLLFRALSDKEVYRPQRFEWLADAALTLYACAVYTLAWDSLVAGLAPKRVHLKDVIATTVLFCMVALPLSWAYYIEEWKNADTWRERCIAYGSTLIYITAGVLSALF